jgi:hypothetical protein
VEGVAKVRRAALIEGVDFTVLVGAIVDRRPNDAGKNDAVPLYPRRRPDGGKIDIARRQDGVRGPEPRHARGPTTASSTRFCGGKTEIVFARHDDPARNYVGRFVFKDRPA